MAIVISDTSPIRALHHLHQLSLLSQLFDHILVPPAVQQELLQPRARFASVAVTNMPGVIVREPSNLVRVRQLLTELQSGEAEAIALAEELHADLLIDELAGRAIALKLGLKITGAVGILVTAKTKGLVPAVLPLLDRLRSELGFFLSDKLIADVRKLVNE